MFRIEKGIDLESFLLSSILPYVNIKNDIPFNNITRERKCIELRANNDFGCFDLTQDNKFCQRIAYENKKNH